MCLCVLLCFVLFILVCFVVFCVAYTCCLYYVGECASCSCVDLENSCCFWEKKTESEDVQSNEKKGWGLVGGVSVLF